MITSALPIGTIAFLFTDIEASTRLYQDHPQAMEAILTRHRAILSQAIESNHGHIFQIIGDATCAAFETVQNCLSAALAGQRGLLAEAWPEGASVRVRMGLHAGSADLDQTNLLGGMYTGYGTLAHAERVMEAAHGGQIVISAAAAELLRFSKLPVDASLRDLGIHQLKGLDLPERIFQACSPGLPGSFPPLRTTGHIPTNLPAELTSFIGREREIAEVKALLEGSRLVTLTGSGGIGKSRLSIRAAQELRSSSTYPDGVWLCELAPISDPELVPPALAQSIGLQVVPRQSSPEEEQVRASSGNAGSRRAMQALTDYLRDQVCLLVIDNCEHLIDACASLIETLLRLTPGVHVLVSSRESLGVSGEQTYRVPSLSLPEFRGVESLLDSDAARLFIARAQAALPGFTPTEANAPAIAQICRRLDGIPLAIELAAARANLLQVEQIAARLSDAFRLLTGGSRASLPRQQTLLASIDWSYNLLSPEECLLLQRLSVFSGGWLLEAAEVVCGSQPIDRYAVLDRLATLVNKSLVVAERRQGSETRYRLLETIRQFARLKLFDSGEGASLRDRHLAYFQQLAEEGEPKLKGRGQVEWMERLDAEMDNFRSALDWGQEAGASESTRLAGLELAAALAWFLCQAGYLAESDERLGKALTILRQMPAGGGSRLTRIQAKLLAQAGCLDSMLHRIERSSAHSQESIALYQRLGTPGDTAFPYFTLGMLALYVDDLELAQQQGIKCLKMYQQSGDKWGMRRSVGLLGLTKEAVHDYAAAQACYQQSLDLAQEIGDTNGTGGTYYLFGRLCATKGQYDQAIHYFQQALPLLQQAKNSTMIATTLRAMSNVTLLLQDFAQAEDLCWQSLERYRKAGDRTAVAVTYSRLGHIRMRGGEYARSYSACAECLRLAQEIPNLDAVAQCLAVFALLAAAENQPERAVRLFGAAQTIYPIYRSNVSIAVGMDIQQALESLPEQMGTAAFQAAWADGQAMGMEQARRYALEFE